MLLCYTSQWLLMAILPLYVRDLGASVFVAGLVLAAFSVTSFTMRPIVGYLTDVRSRLGILNAGTLILGTTGLAFAIPGLAITFIASAIRGIGWASINTASYTVLLKVVPVDRRGEASSYYSVATNTAISFAPVIALWLVAPPSANYHVVFIIAGLSAFAATGVVWMLARTAPELGRSDSRPGDQRLVLSSFIDRRVLLASVLLLSYTVTNPATSAFIPLYAREIGIENSGAYFGVGGIVSIAASVLLARFFNRGSRGVWLVGFTLSLLGLVGLMLSPDIWALTAAGVVVVLGGAVLNPILLAVAIDRADPRRPGAAMATFSLAYQMGNGLGAPLLGLLIEGFGFQGMFVGSIVAMSGGLLLTALRWPSLGNPAAAVTAAQA